MSCKPISVRAGEAPEIEAFLAERLYEFNAQATGYFDGESFSATQRDETGAIRAGICGYTWGGCCHVSYLWVEQASRGQGLGAGLLRAAEEHARARHCSLVLLSSHSFQAPGFYERMGYEQRTAVADHPVGHTNLVFGKRLQAK